MNALSGCWLEGREIKRERENDRMKLSVYAQRKVKRKGTERVSGLVKKLLAFVIFIKAVLLTRSLNQY